MRNEKKRQTNNMIQARKKEEVVDGSTKNFFLILFVGWAFYKIYDILRKNPVHDFNLIGELLIIIVILIILEMLLRIFLGKYKKEHKLVIEKIIYDHPVFSFIFLFLLYEIVSLFF